LVTYVTHIRADQTQLPAILTDVLMPFCSPSTEKYWDHTLKNAIKYPSRSSIHNYPWISLQMRHSKRPNNIYPDPSFKITPKHLSIPNLPYPILLTLNNVRIDKTGNVHQTKQLCIIGYLHLEPFSDCHAN
jgi:hypothetical protein